MAVAWSAVKQAEGSWLFSWTADSGDSFDIWLNGIQLATVTDDEYLCTEPDYDSEPPPLEIVEDESGTFAENELYPPFANIQWRGVDGATSYLVEKYAAGAWSTVATITDISAEYYWYRTLPLEDDTEYNYRVSAQDINGNTGTPVTFAITLARNPSPPSVTYAIDSNGDLDVEAA